MWLWLLDLLMLLYLELMLAVLLLALCPIHRFIGQVCRSPSFPLLYASARSFVFVYCTHIRNICILFCSNAGAQKAHGLCLCSRCCWCSLLSFILLLVLCFVLRSLFTSSVPFLFSAHSNWIFFYDYFSCKSWKKRKTYVNLLPECTSLKEQCENY